MKTKPFSASIGFMIAILNVTAAPLAAKQPLPPILEKPAETIAPVAVERMEADETTLFLLESDGIDLRDAAGHYKPDEIRVENVEMVDDKLASMTVLRFGEKPGEITIPDGKRISFKKGMTIEAWVYLEQPMEKKDRYGFAEKPGKEWDRHGFSLSIVPGHFLTLGFLGFAQERIEGAPVIGAEDRTMKPVEFYPGRCNTMNGLNRFPVRKWTHLAFTYDPAFRVLRTWVDRGVDREALNPWHEIASEICDDDSQPVVLFEGARNMRVAQVRMSSRAREIGVVPPVQVHYSELAYRGGGYVTIIPTSDALPLPCEITVSNIKAPVLNAVDRFTVDDHDLHRYPIPEHIWKCAPSEVVVRIFHRGKEIFRDSRMILNAEADGASSWRFLRGAPWGTGSQRPDWWIDEGNVFSYKGTKRFPVGLYHVTTNDFDFVADLGFTMVGMRKRDGEKLTKSQWEAVLDDCHRKAASRGIFLFSPEDKEGRDGEGFIYGFDEPWGFSFEPYRQTYINLRSARQHSAELPVVAVQNNWQRYRETGNICDVLGVDPYCNHRSPLRFVHDATHAAVRETDGLKPVITVIGNYGSLKARPTFEELRTMSYLGIIGGASGLSYYAWDDGPVGNGVTSNTRTMEERVGDYRKLLAEIHGMEPALTVPNSAPGPAIEPATPRGFFSCAKEANGKTFVIVASDLYKTETRTIVFPAVAGKTLKLLHGPSLPGASPSLVFDARGKATIALPQLGTAVYVTE